MPPYLGWEDAVELIFDGGVMSEPELAGLTLQPSEIKHVGCAPWRGRRRWSPRSPTAAWSWPPPSDRTRRRTPRTALYLNLQPAVLPLCAALGFETQPIRPPRPGTFARFGLNVSLRPSPDPAPLLDGAGELQPDIGVNVRVIASRGAGDLRRTVRRDDGGHLVHGQLLPLAVRS